MHGDARGAAGTARRADTDSTGAAAGLGCEDALMHLLNHVWPNIFETSPHVVNAVNGAIDGCRLALGPAVVLGYTLQARPRRALHQNPACHG